MSYSSLAIANEFIRLARNAGNPVTHMKLQKLIYFAHGWNLALTDAPLIDEEIQAWKYGPVSQSVYNEFRRYGGDPIESEGTELSPSPTVQSEFPTTPYGSVQPRGMGGCDFTTTPTPDFQFIWATPEVPQSDAFTHQLLNRIWDVFGGCSAMELSRMTHEPGTPWAETVGRNGGQDSIPPFLPISDAEMRGYFKNLSGNSQNG